MNDIVDEMVTAANDISVETKMKRVAENSLLGIVSELEFILRYCRNAKVENGVNPADKNLLELIECFINTIEST